MATIVLAISPLEQEHIIDCATPKEAWDVLEKLYPLPDGLNFTPVMVGSAYKNKGVRYTGEVLRKKVGKTGATGAKA
jgi:hypothetical protein